MFRIRGQGLDFGFWGLRFLGSAFWDKPVPSRRPKLGAPVVPFYSFSSWVPLLKPNSRKKGTLIIKGLLGNLAKALEQEPHEPEAPKAAASVRGSTSV